MTEAEVRYAIRRPVAPQAYGVKSHARWYGALSGRLRSPVINLCEELNFSPTQVTKFGGDSWILSGDLNVQQEEQT